MFTRTAFEVKNGSRRTVVPTREIAVALRDNDPQFKYGRISAVKVSFFRPGFGQVETFPTRAKRTTTATSTETPKRRVGRPTNAERAARGIAPAVPTEASVSTPTPLPTATAE